MLTLCQHFDSVFPSQIRHFSEQRSVGHSEEEWLPWFVKEQLVLPACWQTQRQLHSHQRRLEFLFTRVSCHHCVRSVAWSTWT